MKNVGEKIYFLLQIPADIELTGKQDAKTGKHQKRARPHIKSGYIAN